MIRVHMIVGKGVFMFSSVRAAYIQGIRSIGVDVQADVSSGLPMFTMVGYLSSAVREAHDRVRTALRSLGVTLPASRITVNLAPSDLKKEGSGFDLPIAVAVLIALGLLSQEAVKDVMFVGELSLNGEINAVRGVIELVDFARRSGCRSCVVPLANLREGSVIDGIEVLGAGSLRAVAAHFGMAVPGGDEGRPSLVRAQAQESEPVSFAPPPGRDFASVRGQKVMRRAAEVAAAGMHNLLIIGPPGTGKSMTARCLPGILPGITQEEALEVTKIHSIAGLLPEGAGLFAQRPFRSPHHTVTQAGLVGGGRVPMPGEVSLAHRGVLYLDELPEFSAAVLETLRQPLEDGTVTITRNSGTYVFPSDFMLVASMNPCKCGYYPDMARCTCAKRDVKRYLDHISRPLLDRMDIVAQASPVGYADVSGQTGSGESSAQIRERVTNARLLQEERYQHTPFRFNADLTMDAAGEFCALDEPCRRLMQDVYEKLGLTARAYGKILKVARTIADLAGERQIRTEDLAEAIGYRSLDRRYWEGA